jgi:nitrite reductase/ring-hydroxylating ferredoxin subunit
MELIELVRLHDGVARLRIIGNAQSVGLSTAALRFSIESALAAAAPDLAKIEYEDLVASRPAEPAAPRLVRIAPLVASPTNAKGPWAPLLREREVPPNSFRIVEIVDLNLLVANVAGTVCVTKNACPHRGLSFADGMLEGGVLICSSHGYAYDLKLGGRCLNDPLGEARSLARQRRGRGGPGRAADLMRA